MKFLSALSLLTLLECGPYLDAQTAGGPDKYFRVWASGRRGVRA